MEVHEPIKRDRNLNITVIADNSAFGRTAARHGVQLAEVFQASLTVMANFGFDFGDFVVKTGGFGAFDNINQAKNQSEHTNDDNLGDGT